ncbi:hypothetical protein N5D66_29660 [Delftia tsuruhatensis]|uniref:hypothetical protein n=1 Tax=Delftia tsuruhatensis TaxID=180282 RepID=UPI00244AF7DD|nr:hypothetical protein [Delftia tsuruhatensis]MDH0852125.1 hypothetical protein [Delftia tsuruhatensis]
MKRIALMASFFLSHTIARAGYGGMGIVESGDAGPVPFSRFLLALALLFVLFYGAAKFAAMFEGNLGYGYIAIGILVLLIALGIFG